MDPCTLLEQKWHRTMEGSAEDPKTVQTELPYGPQMLELFPKELKSGF